MTTSRKLLLTFLILAVAGAAATSGVYSAFVATTSNDNNSFATGTVTLADNDAGSYIYQGSNKGPGDSSTGCIRVTYGGSLGASVRLRLASAVTNGSAFNLTVERGTIASPTFPSCSGFTATSTAFSGTADTFPTAWGGSVDGKAAGAAWGSGDAVDYRFTISAVDDTTANAHASTLSTGAHSFVWEARSN